MKVTNTTLVITDPCYIEGTCGRQYISESTIYGDWSCMCYKCSKEEAKKKKVEWDEFYFDFFRKYNFNGLSEEEKKEMYEEFKNKKEKFLRENCYGEFCADSGQVAVYDYKTLDDRDKLFVKEHPWCACVIPHYSGEFDYVVENEGDERTAHIVGDGFYTTQSGF